MGKPPARALLVALGGVCLLVTSAVLFRDREPVQAGAPAERALAAAPAGSGSAGRGADRRRRTRPDRRDSPARRSSGRPAAHPRRVRIPAIGVDAAVLPVGVTAAGDLDPPERVATVGWYRYSPGIGAAGGSTVLAGHVDSREQGRGAFFRLGDLRPGDTVTVLDRTGGEHRFRVVARQQWPKTAVPLDRLFALDGAYRLTLITCGGSFDRSARSYRDNIAVTAVPEG